jgi:hypothetical protein
VCSRNVTVVSSFWCVTPCGSTNGTKCHSKLLHLSSGQKLKLRGFLESWHNRISRFLKLKTAIVCSILGRGIRYLLPPKGTGRLWDTPRILLNGYRVRGPLGNTAETFIDWLLPSTVEVKKECSYIFSSSNLSGRTVYEYNVCMYVCMFVRMCVYIYICMYVCKYVCMCGWK